MEIPGVNLEDFECSNCICAQCKKGMIHPQGTNDCTIGCAFCGNPNRIPKKDCDNIVRN